MFDTDSERRIDMASFRAAASLGDGDVKFDLHPRWDRSGRLVCVDATRAGVRQCVIVDFGPSFPEPAPGLIGVIADLSMYATIGWTLWQGQRSNSAITGAWSEGRSFARASRSMRQDVQRCARPSDARIRSIRSPWLRLNAAAR